MRFSAAAAACPEQPRACTRKAEAFFDKQKDAAGAAPFCVAGGMDDVQMEIVDPISSMVVSMVLYIDSATEIS